MFLASGQGSTGDCCNPCRRLPIKTPRLDPFFVPAYTRARLDSYLIPGFAMKSEHRHELKTNELERIAADWGHASERYVQDHTNQLVVVAVALVAIAIGVIYWRMSSGSYQRQSWRALSDANSTADYGTVADKYAGTKVAAWARLREGEAELSSGIRLLFTDRDAGRSDLKKAEENFQKVAGDRTAPPEVIERALFNLARCRESLPPKSSGAATINDAAIEAYERLLKEFPDTIYKELAESRIAALRTGTRRISMPGLKLKIRNRPTRDARGS